MTRFADDDDYDPARERDMITSPGDWPAWPMLPLKKRGGTISDDDYCGFILATDAPPYKVYVSVIMLVDVRKKSWADAVANIPSLDYRTLSDLMATWRVD